MPFRKSGWCFVQVFQGTSSNLSSLYFLFLFGTFTRVFCTIYEIVLVLLRWMFSAAGDEIVARLLHFCLEFQRREEDLISHVSNKYSHTCKKFILHNKLIQSYNGVFYFHVFISKKPK